MLGTSLLQLLMEMNLVLLWELRKLVVMLPGMRLVQLVMLGQLLGIIFIQLFNLLYKCWFYW